MVHDRGFTSFFRFLVPAGRDHIPNRVLQQSTLARVNWTGWSFTLTNTSDYALHITSVIRQYPREDLIVTGRLFRVVIWLQKRYVPRKKSSQQRKYHSPLKPIAPMPQMSWRNLYNVPGPYIGVFLAGDTSNRTLRTSPRLKSLRDTPDHPG